jgi:hypothetical protein
MKKNKVRFFNLEAGNFRARIVMAFSMLFTGNIPLPLEAFIDYMKSQHIGDFTKNERKK